MSDLETTEEIGEPIEKVISSISDHLLKAIEATKSYTDKLEDAQGDDVFKNLLLFNAAALDKYVLQTRLQAEQSFRLSKIVAIMGFGLLVTGIVLGVYSSLSGRSDLNPAYLASIAGILTQFISGVFFYLYNRTLQQLNLFHDRIISSQHVATSFLASDQIVDELKRDQSKANLSKVLMSNAVKGG